MRRITRAYWTLQAIGWENLPARVWQIVKRRARLLERRLPGGEVAREFLVAQFAEPQTDDVVCENWRVRAEKLGWAGTRKSAIRGALQALVPEAEWKVAVSDLIDRLRAGSMRLFSRHDAAVGAPPHFRLNPLTGVEWPTGRHWTRYDQFNPKLGDLKCVWEASRFSWAFALGRQHVRAPESDSAAIFWNYFEAWDRQNPYGLTAQWACGQEASFRAFALFFVATVMLDSPESTPARLRRVTELMWYTARHVAENLVYARSQKNNHAISEAVCLYMIGSMFPEMLHAPLWRSIGRDSLARETARQVYADGSYVQHSMNYHRVLLDDLVWALVLFRAANESPPDDMWQAFNRASNWLLEMVDPATGLAPNYGANDGALVLPLSCCDYTDYRPVAQASALIATHQRRFDAGPWDELAMWCCDPTIRPLPVDIDPRPRRSCALTPGGYYLLRSCDSRAMIRCHTYRDRPNQADMLHLDLNYRGENLLRDGGSYHYFTDEPWQSWFFATAAHNTVEVDGQSQMEKGPRFLWLRWTAARCLRWESSRDGRADYFSGEHEGYRRLAGRVSHRRTILRIDDQFAVVDDLSGLGEHRLTLRWRLSDTNWKAAPPSATERIARWSRLTPTPFSIAVSAPPGASFALLRGQELPRPEGWESRYYAEKSPVPTIVAVVEVALPATFVTLLGPTQQPSPISFVPGSPHTLAIAAGEADVGPWLSSLADARFQVS